FSWWALFAPKGTPKERVDRLHAATDQALADPAVRSRLADLGGGFSQASSGRRRHSGHSRGPRSRNGGRLSKSLGSRRNEIAGTVVAPSRSSGSRSPI